MYDLDSLRQVEFPLSADYIYFNHASISPPPTRTRDRMQWATDCLAAQPMNFFLDDGMDLFETFGRELATFINAASASEIVPITTTSAGLNAVALAVDWQPGDNVLFCQVEFPANAYPWLGLSSEGVEARLVPAVDGGLALAALERLVDERTRLISASAVQFFSGHRTDLAAIGAFCRERNIIFVVDAIQAIGHMKIDVQAMNIDVLATGGQKSLLAAPGVGFMYIRDDLCSHLRPRLIGPNATVDYLHWLAYDLTPLPGAARFLAGTPNVIGMFGVLASLSLMNELGIENIDSHTTRLAAEGMELISSLGYEVVTVPGKHGPIVTFKSGLDDTETDKLVDYLRFKNVSVVKHLDAAGVPHVRLSFHCYNTSEELRQFAVILEGYHS